MAKIPLSSGFKPIDEGWYTFYIYQVDVDEEFYIIKVHLVTADGKTHIERFQLKIDDENWNEAALNIFSYLCKVALNDFDREEIDDPQELVGHYIKGEIIHTDVESKKTPGKINVYANLVQKEVSDGFDEEVSEKAQKIIEKGKAAGASLDVLLG